MSSFSLSKHAVSRALDMALDAEFIRELVLRPDVRRWVSRGSHEPCWLYQKGEIAAPVVEDGESKTVLTFLPATTERWEQEDALPIPGREFDRERWLTPKAS